MTGTAVGLTAYFDCFSGVSGDMILGALVDAGVDLADLQQDIDRLQINASLHATSVDRCGIRATHVTVEIDQQPMTADREQHMHADHDHDHSHDHDDDHTHSHTRLADILAVIDASSLEQVVKDTATQVFRRLTEAEAEVHGADVEHVGLHEVGSLDAIVDITGAICGLHRLGVTRVLCSPLHVGTGTVQCAHGRYPVPVPGVLALCKNVPLVQTDIPMELVTPTGAALITTLAQGYGPAPTMTAVGTGYGAGGRNPATTPNVVRLRLGTTEPHTETDTDEQQQCVIIETNLDDMSPEVFGFLFQRLLAAGARDVYVTPVLMKKNRPGHLLSVLTDPSLVDSMADLLLQETTSLGLRYHSVDRVVLPRTSASVATEYGDVRVKIANLPGRQRAKPEYEDCARLAHDQGVPFQVVYDAAVAATRKEPD